MFDFDGVIVDSFSLCLDSTRTFKLPDIDVETYRRLFDGNVYKTERSLRGQSKPPVIDHELFEYYTKGLMKLNLYQGMDSVLSALQEHEMPIISSSLTNSIETFLQKKSIRETFSAVYGADVHFDKAVKIEMALQKAGVRSEEAVFITDTLGDIREAAKVNVPSIAVTWGFQKEANLKKGNPKAIVKTPEELLKAIQSI